MNLLSTEFEVDEEFTNSSFVEIFVLHKENNVSPLPFIFCMSGLLICEFLLVKFVELDDEKLMNSLSITLSDGISKLLYILNSLFSLSLTINFGTIILSAINIYLFI